MIEVPSSLLVLEHLLENVDFISVGTNDLVQYLLAADRDNAWVAKLEAVGQDTGRVMLGILIFIAVSNLAGSYYLLQNDLFWVLMIVVPHLAIYGSASTPHAATGRAPSASASRPLRCCAHPAAASRPYCRSPAPR
jgi:hypothetical protein